MELILGLAWMYIKSNPELAVGLLLGIAELITRLTPTKADDGFIKRIGALVDMGFDLVKMPNRKKG
jgi:hypothetical protein